MGSAHSCGWKRSTSASFPPRSAINGCCAISATEECGMWHHLCSVLLGSRVLWELRSAGGAGKKMRSSELGDDSTAVLPSIHIHAHVLCPGSKFREVESGSRGRKYSEKFAKIVTLWLTEGAQLPQGRMQTLRAGMNLHCSWAYTVRYMRITQKSPSPSWSLSTSCAEIRAPGKLEFRLGGAAGEDTSLSQYANTINSYHRREDLLEWSIRHRSTSLLW